MTETPTRACPHCDQPVDDGARFCESCGRPVDPSAGAPGSVGAAEAVVGQAALAAEEAAPGDDLGTGPISAPTRRNAPTGAGDPAAPGATGRRPCLSCGGEVGADGYCEQCGTKAASERDHFREQPAAWVAGVCDRGLRHSRNEDAMALLASPTPGEHAVLVVLDGVSRTDDSHLASLAGARAALETLRTPLPRGLGTPESRASVVARAFADAVVAANDAVVATTPDGSLAPPSATFVAAIVEGGADGDTVWFANIGDSRAYWLPDGAPARQLSVDDSAAEQQIRAGVPRIEAETGPMAHAITRWLGPDAPDLTPRVGRLDVDRPGWVLVCSDGLWNYASEPDALAQHVRAVGASDPAVLSLALVDFANACGGQDNITATLARVGAGHNDPHDATERPVGQATDMHSETERGSDG